MESKNEVKLGKAEIQFFINTLNLMLMKTLVFSTVVLLKFVEISRTLEQLQNFQIKNILCFSRLQRL